MIPLITSLGLLFIAPFLYSAAIRVKKVWSAIEKLMNIVVTALVVLHLLPESIHIVGWYAVALAFVGLFLPGLLERLWERGAERVHLVSIILSLIGLIIHGLMDGAALATPVTSSNSLPLAVVLHTLPAGMLICSIFYPRSQKYVPPILLATLGLSTLFGFFAGARFFDLQEHSSYFAAFQAFVAGSFLHITFDLHEPHSHHGHIHHHDHDHGPCQGHHH